MINFFNCLNFFSTHSHKQPYQVFCNLISRFNRIKFPFDTNISLPFCMIRSSDINSKGLTVNPSYIKYFSIPYFLIIYYGYCCTISVPLITFFLSAHAFSQQPPPSPLANLIVLIELVLKYPWFNLCLVWIKNQPDQ